MLHENGYPNSFCDEIFERSLTEKDAKKKTVPDTSEKKSYYITIPHLESESRSFIKNLTKIIKNKMILILYPIINHLKLANISN